MAALIKSRSDIWKYFTLSDDKKDTKCKLCNATLKYPRFPIALKNTILADSTLIKLIYRVIETNRVMTND